jgi:hypothetical protein
MLVTAHGHGLNRPGSPHALEPADDDAWHVARRLRPALT